MIKETIGEPFHSIVADAEVQKLNLSCSGQADIARYKCESNGENIPFKPTFMFQSTMHSFSLTNESSIPLPVKWSMDDMKQRGRTAGTRGLGSSQSLRTMQSRSGTAASAPSTIPCPFSIEPAEFTVAPNTSHSFALTFLPTEADDFVYLLRGDTIPSLVVATTEEPEPGLLGPIRMVLRGTGKRPICHFELTESLDYLMRRPLNLKNEVGLQSPIETTDLRVVELESCGLRTRNTFRFHIINPTADNFEFLWEAVGDPSPFWRCVQSSGMLFGGKRIEIVFEYLPEDTSVAESFFEFKLPKVC